MTELKNDLNKIAPALALGDKMLEGGETANTSCLALVPQIDTFRGTVALSTYHENGSEDEDPLYVVLDVEEGAAPISDCGYSTKPLFAKIPERGYSEAVRGALDLIGVLDPAAAGDDSSCVVAIVRAGTLKDAIRTMGECLNRECPDSWRQNGADIMSCGGNCASPAITQEAIDIIMRYADHDPRAPAALVIAQRMKKESSRFESHLRSSVMN